MIAKSVTITPGQNSGFSLIELMIALVIGLIVVLAITQAFLTSENRRRTIISDNDAQTGGMLTLYMVEREIRNSGFGLPNTSALGCTVHASFGGSLSDPGTFPLAPVTISASADGITDQVLALSGTNGAMPLPVRLISPFAAGDGAINVGVNYFFGPKQLSILADPANPADCTMVEITDKGVDLNHAFAGASPWNQNNAIYPAAPFPTGSYVFNMGALSLKRFFVNPADSTLRVTETANTVQGTSSTTRALATGVVGFKGRYVFDGSGLSGPQHLVAVKLAIVSRGSHAERSTAVDGSCNTTLNLPKWSDGTTLPIPQSSPDWKCYRYKVSETTVSLRNRVWNLP
ncbi:MAG: prepilin-type N-terminal cleavage/methylation domain-containing protein [Betaproteobacteria bacterium]